MRRGLALYYLTRDHNESISDETSADKLLPNNHQRKYGETDQ